MLEKSGYTIDQQEDTAPTETSAEPLTARVAEPEMDGESVQLQDVEKVVQETPSHHSDKRQPLPSMESWDERLKQVTRSSHEIAEAFRMLRAKILLPQDGRSIPRTIMVTSALPSEGKTFVTANLGVALAQGVDQHSLIVDCDLRHPTLANLFGASALHGLADYLKGEAQLPDLIQKTAEPKLSLLASGPTPGNPSELLGSARMHELVDELSLRYSDRFVIFDSPPLQVASESMILSQAVDGVILVVRHGLSGRSLIEKFISDIGKEKIIGVIFNGHKRNPISSKLVDKNHYYYGNYYNKQTK